MSDFGMFEADEATQAEPRLAARTAGRKLEAAIDEVRAKFGRFLVGATGIDEFGDRWHLSKADIRATVEPHVFPNTGTMRRVQNAMKADWKLAHPYKLAIDHDDAGFGSMPTADHERNLDTDETYQPSSGNLVPSGDFEGWKDSVDQGGPEKVQRDFTPGGDSGSDRHAAADWDKKRVERAEKMRDRTKGTPAEQEWQDEHDRLTGGNEKEAAMLVADIYTDFARSNGMRVASLDTLDRYASTGIAEADYRLLESMILRTAEDCDEDDDSDEADDESESEDDDSDEGGEAPDFGGSDDFEDTDGDGDHDDDDHHDGEGGEEEYDFGGGGGGDVSQTFTVPDEAPELDPRLQQEIPAGDTDGSAPVPPEVIDSLLGLPEGTIEQLLLEEVSQGAQGGGDQFGGAPQGGGGDFLGGGGDDAEQEPPRVARRRQAAPKNDEWYDEDFYNDNEAYQTTSPERLEDERALRERYKGKDARRRQAGALEDYRAEHAGVPTKKLIKRYRNGEDGLFEELHYRAEENDRDAAREVLNDYNIDDEDDVPGDDFSPDTSTPSWNYQDGYDGDGYSDGRQDPRPPHLKDSRRRTARPDESEQSLMGRQRSQQRDAIDTKFGPRRDTSRPDIQDLYKRARNGDPTAYAQLRAVWNQRGWTASRAARTFWAAEGDEQPGGGEPSGGGQPPQGDPSQGGDPAAMGMDPSAMGGGQPMLPPPGSGAVQPPQPPQPLEDQPAEDALLDTANQAIMQMIDRETQEYQQIIDPLSQALQAIQFAQQVEQAEHPLDVTPPEGTVNVDPSQAPGGQPPMQQQARRRQARRVGVLRNAARLIAGRYGLSHGGERMLIQAMGRRNYEHVREALQLLPPDHLQRPEHRAAVRHIGEMFAADNPRFNKDVWMRSVLGSAPGSRLPFDRPRLAGETLVHTPTMDAFEWENDQPRIDDNIAVNDLPKMKGASASDAVSRFQRWTKWREQNGLVVPGGDGGIHNFMQKTRNPGKAKIGDEASAILHRSMGFEPDAPKSPKAKPLKAVNPTLRKPKAPKAGRRTAAGFFLDGPRDEDEGRPDPSTLHCSRCGHTGPGASDDDENLCPGCPHSVMDYRFYGHPTKRLIDDFHRNPDSNYGDALFEELKHRSEIDDDREAAGAVEENPRKESHGYPWERDEAVGSHPSGQDPDDVASSYEGWDPDDNPGPDDPRIKGASRTASGFFTRRVPGWRWDDHLNGYVSKEARAFTCHCGQRIAAPSYRSCDCGKVWNVYAIGDSHHLASDTADMYVAREIEVRPGVVMANRRMAGTFDDFFEWGDEFNKKMRRDFHLGDDEDDYDPTRDPKSFEYQDPDQAEAYCADCEGELGDRGTSRPMVYPHTGEKLCEDCMDSRIDEEMDIHVPRGWDPDGMDFGPDDPRVKGANRRTAGWGDWENIRKTDDEPPPSMENYRSHEDDEAEELARRRHDLGSYYPGKFMHADKGDCTCWEGYERVPGTEPCASKSCRKKTGAALFARLAAGGMSYEDTMKHIDDVLSAGEGHELHHQPGVTPGDVRTESYEFEDCPQCGAHGNLGDDLCPMCDGTGAVGSNRDAGCEACDATAPSDDLEWISTGEQVCPECADSIDGPVCPSCGEREASGHHPGYPCTGAGVVASRREADWTKYDDDVDPVVEAYGKPKPPSTKIPKQPRDWAKRTPAGTWQGPAIPHKRK